MKKLLLMITSILLLTGCGQRTALEVLDDVIENTASITNMEADSKVVFKMDTDGIALDISFPFNIAVTETNEQATFKVDIGENMILGQMELYGKITEEMVDLYFPSSLADTILETYNDEEKWLSYNLNLAEIEASEDLLDNLDYKKVILEENFVFIDKEDGIGHYQFVVNEALLERYFNELDEEFEKTEETSKINLKIDVYIDLEKNEITKIYMDLKDMIVDIIGETEDFDKDMISQLSFEMNFKNNSTTVTIPEDVINSATSYEDYLNTIVPEEEEEI